MLIHYKMLWLLIRLGASWRKSSQEIPRMSSLNNQTNAAYENQTEQNFPWYWHNYNQTCSSAAPQSPHCHYHHHMCMQPSLQAPGASNDPMLMQQFIQTQQMLINSISQCNQLLWDQQREINNLNSAVLLVSLTDTILYMYWIAIHYGIDKSSFDCK